ncbi:hypothetical protein [Nonomuraea sp. NPDC003201]
MRRDWRQAAGAAWLALAKAAPPTLRLKTGIDHLAQLAAHDAVAARHLQAARAFLNREST